MPTIPTGLGQALQEAADAGIVVGITTRCSSGGPAGFLPRQMPNVYSFPHLNGQKLRLLLMAALGFAQGDRAVLDRVLTGRQG